MAGFDKTPALIFVQLTFCDILDILHYILLLLSYEKPSLLKVLTFSPLANSNIKYESLESRKYIV